METPVRILIWIRNWPDSASVFWKSLIILESAWSFLTKLHIQVKLMDICDGESYLLSESWSGLRIDETLHLEFWKSWIISEVAWSFQTKLHIQVKLMDIKWWESPVSCQIPDLDSELIRLCIPVLEKSDYLGIVLIVLTQIVYSSKTNRYLSIQNGYKQWRVL